jgi:UDP-glucose 4-epimerase
MSQQRLLVIGVGSELGSLAAALLEQDARFSEILGIDVHPPRRRLRRTTFVRIEHDESHSFVRHVVAHRPDVIVHLGVWEPHARLGTNDARKATGNYARALCDVLTQLDGLSRLIVRSGLEVYGVPLQAPADEATPVAPTSTYGHMLTELEAMVNDAAPRTATVTTLRFAPVIGAHVPSPLGRLLRLPIIPIDPFSKATFQVVADDDAARAVVHAASHGIHGVVNVAAHDPTTVGAVARQGRRMVAPVVAHTWRVTASLTTLAGAPLPDHVVELIRHGRTAVSNIRDIGYLPAHSTHDVIKRLYSWPSIVRIAPMHPAEQVA